MAAQAKMSTAKQRHSKQGAPATPAPATRTKAPTRTKTVTADKRREKGEARAQRIINATIDLIAAEGLGRATMQRIATQIGGTSALVVFHFRNMENLYKAVLEHLSALYDAMWQELVEAPRLTAAQRLACALDFAQGFMQRYPKGVSVLIAFSGDRKSLQVYRKIPLPRDRAYLKIRRQPVDEIC